MARAPPNLLLDLQRGMVGEGCAHGCPLEGDVGRMWALQRRVGDWPCLSVEWPIDMARLAGLVDELAHDLEVEE